MDDIFLSYASADRDRVQPLVQVLEERGWSVWWDREIPPGMTWPQVIESALESTRAMLVIWTANSVESEWVEIEASKARERDTLIPVMLDQVDVPLQFSLVQAADLTNWSPDSPNQPLEQVLSRLEEMLGAPRVRSVGAAERTPTGPSSDMDDSVSPKPPKPSGGGRPQTRRSSAHRLVVLSSLVVVAAVVGWQALSQLPDSSPDSNTTVAQPRPSDPQVNQEPPPPADPPGVTFTSSNSTIARGESLTLSWSTSDADRVTLTPPGRIESLSGSRTVSPQTDESYVLQASGPGGTTTRTVDVRVSVPPEPEVSDSLRSLVRDINDPSRATRRWSTQLLVTNHRSRPAGVVAVLDLLASSELESEGRINCIYFLSRTSNAAWTPELLDRAQRAVAGMWAQYGSQTQDSVASLDRFLDGVRPSG